MTDGFGVHTDEMRAHAEKLRGVADEVGVAQDAAGEASLGGTEAYGILCSPILTPLMGVVEAGGMAAIAAARGAVEATSVGIKGMADGYDEVQQAVSELFEKIRSEIGGN
ncbi:type VII secretion target [Saccharopolyspora hordei]|uniref:ESX-1 secretion-associated protein n=1 Tax=Saccharopolyspora hordei TaxID=1838 RepID=A0A853AFB0_9PSEU|nr:type VII secretion target [Saccharopolyspora hordei]NYI82825.1 hypothetical protein [Saccharopolyspora hordei]